MTMLRRPDPDKAASTASVVQADAYPRFAPVGEAALTVEFGNAVEPALNAQVIALDTALAAAELDGIVETVPSYRSLLVCYEPLEISYHKLVAELRRLLAHGLQERAGRAMTWDVPVVYEASYGIDLPEVVQRTNLTEEAVVSLHTSAEYVIYTIGYAPGMPYLGGVPPALHLSRRDTPRPHVEAGAVMIGGAQACIVPTTVPSAWYQLGLTPLRPFDVSRADPFLFRPGDRIRFRRVALAEFEWLSRLSFEALLQYVRTEA
jgi:KipI family sensor histidine kinase inhibitor